MANENDVQMRFVELLTVLTESGKVQWARSKNEIGFVYCSAPTDLIVFEVRGDSSSGGLVDPTDSVGGVVSKCRNISYLWLGPTPGLSGLLKLLRRAPLDDERFVQMRRQAHSVPVQALESLM